MAQRSVVRMSVLTWAVMLSGLTVPPTSIAQGNAKATDEQRAQLKQALLSGNAAYFERIAKPDLIALNAGSDSYSFIHDVCLASHDRLPQCIAALMGGMKSKHNVGVVCKELLYLNATALRQPGSEQLLTAIQAKVDQLIVAQSNPATANERIGPYDLAELKARYSLSPEGKNPPVQTAQDSTPEALLQNRRLIGVSGMGDARATAYTMTSLFSRHRDQLFLSWMDKPVTNCLGLIDPEMSRASVVCVLGRPTDDHGNAALVKDTRGRLHAIVGAHHGPFLHRMAEDADKPHLWRDIGETADKATHPCLVCDRQGVLHLVYRSSAENPWLLRYERYTADGKWSPAVPLLRAAKTWYVTWTNSLAVGPDNVLHLVFGVARFDAASQSTYYGAAHIYSDDGGDTWRQFGGQRLALPIDVGALATIGDRGESVRRTVSAEEATTFKGTDNEKAEVTLQMLLSNTLVDAANRPWVIVHNNLEKSASVYSAEQGQWTAKADLSKTVSQTMPGWVISEQSSLSRHRSGLLEAVLMIVPLKNRNPRSFVGWQSNELELLRVIFDSEGKVLGSRLVLPENPAKATWLPNLEKWDWNHPFDHPALLFSSGVSSPPSRDKKASKRETLMEVWLDIASE